MNRDIVVQMVSQKAKTILESTTPPVKKENHWNFERWLGNIRIRWRNWKVRGTGKAYRSLTKSMRNDPDYAHSWYCNIAMPIYDGAKGKLTPEEANSIAENLMKHLFEMSPKQYAKE